MISYTALKVGDPRRLFHSRSLSSSTLGSDLSPGFDYGGRLCGVDPGVEGKGLEAEAFKRCQRVI